MGRNSPKLDVVVGLTQCSRIASWWWCCRSLSWCLVLVLVLQWRGTGSIAVLGVVHVPLAYSGCRGGCCRYGWRKRRPLGSSRSWKHKRHRSIVLHWIGAEVWILKLHMDQWSTCPYGKAGLPTGDLGSPAMSPLLALVVEHVEHMGLEGLQGCSHNNAGALLLPARDQLHTRCVLDGWSSFRMPLAVELSGLPVPLQSQSNNFERHRGQGSLQETW